MKKLFVAMLAFLLVLTGCGKKEAPKTENKVLKVAGLNGGYETDGWNAVIKAFEETKGDGTKVETTFEKNISDVLRPQIQAGDTPDVIYLAIGGAGKLTDTMIAEKKIEEISDVFNMKVLGEEKTVNEKLTPGVANTLRTAPYGDGKQYLAPNFYAPTGLFYNKGLFESKGWTLPTTWDEMFALGDKAKAEGIALFTYPTTGYFDALFSAILNEAVGPEKYAKLMAYDLETWKDPETKKAFEIVGKLAQYTHPDTVAQANKEGFTKNQQLVLDNKALFVTNGTWLPGEMEKAPRAEGFEWGFTAIPKLTADGKTYSSTFTEEVYIPSDAKNKELAKEFITFLYSDKAIEIFAANKNAIQPTTNSSQFIKDESIKDFYNVYDKGAVATSVGFKSVEAVEGVDLTSETGILYGTVNEVVSGQKTVDQWYDAVIEAVAKFK